MKYEDLSVEDQALLATDFGEQEKVAAAELGVAQEMYNTAFEKLAAATADAIDEEAKKEDESEKKEKMDEEGEKKAADLSAFIERGYFDGLRKLGSDRHGDENAYLYPFLIEKCADGEQKAKLLARLHAAFTKGVGHVSAAGHKGKEHAIAAAKKLHETGKKGGYHALGGAAVGTAAGEAHGRHAEAGKHPAAV